MKKFRIERLEERIAPGKLQGLFGRNRGGGGGKASCGDSCHSHQRCAAPAPCAPAPCASPCAPRC